MKYKYTAGIGILLFVLNTVHADRTIWYVHPDSTLHSIQAGLDSCAAQDIVLVGPGIYYENIVWPNTQGIHLISELGPDETVIDGNNIERVMIITSLVDSLTIVTGFTIQNGCSSGSCGGIYCNGASPTIINNIISNNYPPWPDEGGGICCEGNSTAIIRNNVIANNVAGFIDFGGGIKCIGSSPIITGNIITENGSFSGGGIYCNASSPIIADNTITLNITHWFTVGGPGAGISCVNNSTPLIRNNIIATNTTAAYTGGGIYCEESSPIIDSCTISDNYWCGILNSGTNPVISYCNITGNTAYGVNNLDPGITVVAEYNWWGDATGPYHPTLNPGGLGDTVSDYVDFDPWLSWPVGIEERQTVISVEKQSHFTATIFHGPLQLPEGKKCKVYDITGRIVKPEKIAPGIYFVEIDNEVVQKAVKIR